MLRHLLIILCLANVAAGIEPTPPQAAPPATAPTNRRVLIVSIDGCRPDLVLRADMPTLQAMVKQSAYTLWAMTTVVSVTIPSHVSMLTGAKPQVHEMEWNHDLPLAEKVYPKVPTIFEVARDAGYTTGMVAGKGKFECLDKPGTLLAKWYPDGETVVPDLMVLSHTLQMIRSSAPEVLFVHFPQNDTLGHAIGWGSPRQVEHLHEVDSSLREILLALRERNVLDNTLVIVSADHGGAGKTHGPEDSRSRCIPWIAIGPGVRHDVDLSCDAADRTIHIEDTFATAAEYLQLTYDDSKLFGVPVDQVWNRPGEILYVGTKVPQGPMPVNWDQILGPPAWRFDTSLSRMRSSR